MVGRVDPPPRQAPLDQAPPHPAGGPPLGWAVDPPGLALAGSADARAAILPAPFCIEVGRRLLAAELEFSSWVLRRVETVSLAEGRSVLRRMTIEFQIRDDAPTFVAGNGVDDERRLWL